MFDSDDKLRNGLGLGDPDLVVALLPDGIMDQDDLENHLGIAYFQNYDPTPEAPEAEFGYTIDPEHVRADFFDQSTNAPTAWSWDFGDPDSNAANFSTLENPVHEFTGYGTFTVRLRVENAFGEDTVTHEVTITDPGMPYIPINHHQEQGRGNLIEQFKIRGA